MTRGRTVTLIVLAVALLTAATLLLWPGADPPARCDTLAADVRDSLSRQAVTALATEGRCTADVLGAEPLGADRPHTVYVWAHCTHPDQSESSGPAVIRLGPSGAVERPGDGAAYWPGVERLFPQRLHDIIAAGGTDA